MEFAFLLAPRLLHVARVSAHLLPTSPTGFCLVFHGQTGCHCLSVCDHVSPPPRMPWPWWECLAGDCCDLYVEPTLQPQTSVCALPVPRRVPA